MIRERQFLNNLQGLRVFAAGSVMLVHLLPIYGIKPPFGLYGVDVFFVLSGFLMARIAQKNPAGFFTRRVTRIVPLYWLCTFGVFVVAKFMPNLIHTTTPDALKLLKSLLFIPYRKESGAMQPLLFLGWSLNYEMYFYALFALSLKSRWVPPPVLVCLLVGIPPLVACFLSINSDLIRFYCEPMVLEFLLGVCVYYLASRFPQPLAVQKWGLPVAIGCAALLPLIEEALGTGLRPVLLGLPAGALVFLAVVIERNGRSLSNPIALALGDASFALYLIHPYVFQIGEKILNCGASSSLLARIASALGLVLLALVAACLVHFLVEVPMLEKLRRLCFGAKAQVDASSKLSPVVSP